MSIRLIRREGTMLPGGFPYTDPRTGFKFDGFDAGGFGDQVYRIINHRLRNTHIYPKSETQWFSFEFVANQLDEFQCQRYGNDPRYCSDSEKRQTIAPKLPVSPNRFCNICKVNLVEKLCPTCGGRKLVSYICPKCGAEYGK